MKHNIYNRNKNRFNLLMHVDIIKEKIKQGVRAVYIILYTAIWMNDMR